MLFRADESRDYTAWSRDDWLRLINSASDQLPYDVTDRYLLWCHHAGTIYFVLLQLCGEWSFS